MLLSNPISLMLLSLLVALLPIVIGVATSYIKVSIVLGMVRNALGTQQTPGNMVIMVLSLAITCFVMAPVFEQSKRLADENDLLGLLSQSSLDKLAAIKPVFEPWRKFMQLHTGQRELLALSQMVKVASKQEAIEKPDVLQVDDKPADPDIIAWRLLLPAFVLSELKQAFTMGFVLLLPFLVIDLIVANILVGLNMIMVSPIMVALPLKLILFVMSDGWLLITKGLINSYNL